LVWRIFKTIIFAVSVQFFKELCTFPNQELWIGLEASVFI